MENSYKEFHENGENKIPEEWDDNPTYKVANHITGNVFSNLTELDAYAYADFYRNTCTEQRVVVSYCGNEVRLTEMGSRNYWCVRDCVQDMLFKFRSQQCAFSFIINLMLHHGYTCLKNPAHGIFYLYKEGETK